MKGQGSQSLPGTRGSTSAPPRFEVPYAALVRTVELPDGRAFAYDDVGDPGGAPMVYLHGTPDSRRGRPDDAGAAAAGVRMLAVDRPGFGDSDVDPAASLTSLGDDLARLLDAARVERAVLLGWSGGGLAALGAAVSPRSGRGSPPSG